MRLLLAIALLFTMTPGMTEVAEAAMHLLVHADLPHHADEPHDEGCAEHTCTPLAHHCGCHATMSARTSTLSTYAANSSITSSKLPTVESAFSRAGEPPPLRPPIA